MNFSRSTKLFASLVALDVILILSHFILVQFQAPAGLAHFYSTMLALLDVNGEGNLQSWYSAAKLLAGGLIFAIIFAIRGRWSVLLTSIVLVLMSVDESAQIHEHAGKSFSELFLREQQTVLGRHSASDWPYTYGIFATALVAVAVAYLIRNGGLQKNVILVLVAGLVVLLSGAIGLEIVPHISARVATEKQSELLILLNSGYAEELLENIGSSAILLSAILGLETVIGADVAAEPEKVLNAAAASLIPVAAVMTLVAVAVWRPATPFYQVLGRQQEWHGCQLPRTVGKAGKNCTAEFTQGKDQGFLSFGPYIQVIPGDYRIRIWFSSSRPKSVDVGRWDIIFDGGRQQISSGALNGTIDQVESVLADFTVHPEQRIRDMEIRTFATGEGDLRLYRIAIERLR